MSASRSLRLIAGLTLSLAACGEGDGSVTVQKAKTTSSTGGTGGESSTSGTGGDTGSTTGGGCKADGEYAGITSPADCCSGKTDANGLCNQGGTGVTTGSSGTRGSGTGTTGVAQPGTSTTTGGACPRNMPDIFTGQSSQVSGACVSGGEIGNQCPTGFTCISGQCRLNGVGGGVQVTLSFDVSNDIDLYVVEPGSPAKTIYYGNRGPRPYPDGGAPTRTASSPIGWLDRDSNAACNRDNINVENVIYPTNQSAPTGQYSVRVNYYDHCPGLAQNTPWGIQARVNGLLYKVCGTLTTDVAGGESAGGTVLRFTVP